VRVVIAQPLRAATTSGQAHFVKGAVPGSSVTPFEEPEKRQSSLSCVSRRFWEIPLDADQRFPSHVLVSIDCSSMTTRRSPE
jgi:hypothetical protein